MRRWSAGALVVTAVLCAAASERPALRAQGRAADTFIPAAFAIPLTSPSVPGITLSTIQRVLLAANVPFGIEGAPPQDPPLIDLAHPPTEVANLHAMRVGAALDAIARVDPSVRWSDDDGVIVVRLTRGPTWLDGALPPFKASNANLSSALDALITAFDPARAGQVKPYTVFALISPTGEMVPPRFTLSRDRGTVVDGLDAIVRAAPGSWRVEYAGASLDARDASILVSEARVRRFTTDTGDTYAVESPVAIEARTHRSPNLVRVGLDQDLPRAILLYAQAARVTVGLEALPLPRELYTPTGVVLQLDRTQPLAALKQLVAYDSRYELTDDHGVFHVRPHGDPVIPGYAAPVTSFSASNEPLGDLMGRFTALAGAAETPPGMLRMLPPVSVLPRGPGGQAEMDRQQREVPLTPVSLDFAGPGTVRDVLDALCRDRGFSWEVRPTPQGGAVVMSSLTLTSVDGWSISRRAIMPALRPAVRPVPVPPGTVALPSTPETLFEVLPMADLRLRFGAYIRETAHTPGERAAAAAAAEQAPRITLQDLRISDLLTTLLQQVPGYAWTEDRSVYHIQPLALGTSPDEPINRPVDRLDVQLTDLDHAERVVVGLITGGPAGPGPPNMVHPLGGPMHLVLDHGTVRDALDAILRTGQAQSWTLVSSSDGLHRSITLRLCAPSGRNCGSESTQDPGPR